MVRMPETAHGRFGGSAWSVKYWLNLGAQKDWSPSEWALARFEVPVLNENPGTICPVVLWYGSFQFCGDSQSVPQKRCGLCPILLCPVRKHFTRFRLSAKASILPYMYMCFMGISGPTRWVLGFLGRISPFLFTRVRNRRAFRPALESHSLFCPRLLPWAYLWLSPADRHKSWIWFSWALAFLTWNLLTCALWSSTRVIPSRSMLWRTREDAYWSCSRSGHYKTTSWFSPSLNWEERR